MLNKIGSKKAVRTAKLKYDFNKLKAGSLVEIIAVKKNRHTASGISYIISYCDKKLSLDSGYFESEFVMNLSNVK